MLLCSCLSCNVIFFNQVRFFMEIMWPIILFMGLVWLRRVNPLYRQHECEKTTLMTEAENS